MISRFLAEEDTFSFGCQMTGDCCREYAILCTPYDIVRLRTGTGESTGQMLERGLFEITEVSYSAAFTDDSVTAILGLFGATLRDHIPIARLVKTRDAHGEKCPNLKDALCGVYEHRPGVCRSYPLGRVRTPDGPKWFEREYGCPGKGQGTQTVRDWIVESQLEDYVAGNDWFAQFAENILAAGIDYTALNTGQRERLSAILYDFDSVLGTEENSPSECLTRIEGAAGDWLDEVLRSARG